MEDIEYLEEYEDLVLPALNSAAAAAAASSTSTSIEKNHTVTEFIPKSNANDDDGSSSSLDQDIFNCLFDDHSDDDNVYIEKIDDNTLLKQKSESSASLDSLDLLVDDLGQQVAKEIALQKAQQEEQNKINIVNAKSKASQKVTPSTPKPKTFVTKPSVVPTVSLNTNRNTTATATQQNKNLTTNKQKSIATVRPTVQNKQQQQQRPNTTLIQRTSFIQQQQIPSSSTATTSSASFSSVKPTTSRSVQLPVLARKPLSSGLSSSPSSSAAASTLIGNKFKPNPVIKPTIIRRPATIVKPEKIITKDPVEDPLSLDDLSEAASDNYSVSDISGETYNSISDFYEDDDEDDYSGDNDEYYDDELEDDISNNSQIIELSNDSSGSTLNLEDLRASTPSPVISKDQDIPNSSFGFNKRKTKSPHLLRNRDILQGLLTKGEKPKLLELINQYAYKNNSSEEEEEINEVIDITDTTENLIENRPQTKVTITSDTPITITSDTPIATTKKQDNTINPTHSDKNKSKTGKKSVKVMDNIKASGRDLTSPGAASDDSYLSAVEELLEESYAEAMKKMNDSDDPAVDELLEESYAEAMKQVKEKSALQNQEVGAEMKVAEKLEVVGEQEKEVKNEPEKNKQKITKMGIVTDYEDVSIDQEIKGKESNVEMLKATENKQIITLTEEVKQVETNLNDKEEDLTKDKVITDNPLDITQQSSSKLENVVKEQPEETSNAENETITKPSDSIQSTINESPNTRKKKRFRNLISPEPTENKELKITEETVTDGGDFKGFEEVNTNKFESTQELNVIKKNVKDQTIQKDDTIEKTKLSINESPKVSTSACGSFKSPTKAHKSAIEKSKDKSSRDSSPTRTSKTSSHKSRDNSPSKTLKSSSDTKSKSSRDSSKDSKSSRDSSRDSKEKQHKDISKDRNSRENKDRSRESSKDSSKHIKSEMKSTQDKSLHKPTTETSSKQHHKGHRKSRDSKDSSKSRESSKSRDNKEFKEKKSETKDSHSSSLKEKKSETKDTHSSSNPNVKNDSKSIQISKDKTDKEPSKDIKISKEKEINTKQSGESKDIKIVDKTKDPKDLKSATEKVTDKSKNKETENMKKPQSISKTSTPSSSGKPLLSPVKVSKSTTDLKEPKDKKDSLSSRDSSKDRKDVSKTKDSISGESDKKSKEVKKSGTSSHEYSKDRKDMTNSKDLKNTNKIHTIQQSPKTLPKDSNESSTSKDVKNTNETNSLKDSKLAENSNKLKSSQDNKIFIKSKDSSKETKKVLNDNKSKHKEISLQQTPTKSSNLKKSTSTLNSTKDVLDNTKKDNNPTSIKDSKEDKGRAHAKSQEQNVSFEIVEMKKEVNTVVTKSEKLKPKETTDNKSKANEAESVTKKTEKTENIIMEKKTVLNKDTKGIKPKSEKLILGRPIIKLTRLEDIKPKQVKKIGDIKTDDVKGEIKENKTTKVDNNTKTEGSKSKESTVKPEIIDLKSNNTEKDTGESKEKKDEERKCGIVEKKTESRKLKIKRGNTKPAEVKSQESKDYKSQIIKSQEVSTLTETKTTEVKDKSMENMSETKNPHDEHKTEITQETEKTKSDTKDVVDKKVEESVENTKQPIKTSADSKSEEIKGVPDKKDKIPKPIKTRKTIGSKSEDVKSCKDTEKKLEETKDEVNKDKTIELKSQEDARVHDKNDEKSEPMKTRKTIGSEEAKTSRDTEKNLGETNDESVELKSQEDAKLQDKNEEKSEPSEKPTSLETATATENVDSEAKDKLEENNIIPMKTRKSFESKLEKSKSAKVAVTDETAVENKPEPRKTRNRHDSKSEDQKPKESSGNAEKEGENLVENKPEPRITRNRHDPKTEEHNSKETSENAEKKEDNSKSDTTSDNTEGLIKIPYDKSEENKPEPRKTRNRHDSKTEEQKSEETGGIAEKTVEETKCETKSEKPTNLVETPNDESGEYKPEPRKTRNRHDSKTEEEKSKEPIEEPKSVKNEALLDNAKEESVENKPEPRITRNRQDIKIEEQKSTETNDNADKKVKENKSKTKSVKTAGLADKAEEVSLENKPEPRITRNRHDTKIDEQKSTETSDKAEQMVEENKSEIKSGQTAVLVDKAEEVLLENKPELVEENKSETSAEKTAGLKNEMVENKPEQRKTRNRHDLKTEEQNSKEISGNVEKEVEEIKTQKATGFEENVKNVSVKYKPEPRKTRNRLDSKTEEQNSTKTSGNAEKKVEIDESKITTEKTVDLEETAKNEMVENKLNPKETRNRNEFKESEQISGNAETKAEETKSETKIADLEENVKDESVENKPELRKTRSRHDLIIEEQKSKETSGNTEEKVEEKKTETKSEKTAGLEDESVENKPETRKTRNRDDLKTDEQKSEEISGKAEKKAEEIEIEKTAVLEERARDESLENKPEPRKTRNADKKVEEIKSENKSVKTADIAEKTIDKSEENKPESRRTRNRHDSKTEDHKTSGNLEKEVEETKSETSSNKTAGLMKKPKDESIENKADPRKTRSRYDSKSEELKSEETSQNKVKTVEVINIETVENTTGLKSDEAANKDTAKAVEKIAGVEESLEPVKSEESKTIVEEKEHKEENQKEDLITVQNKPKVDKVSNAEKNTCAEKKICSKEPEPNNSSTETSNNENLKNEIENVTEYKTESLKDMNETSSREEKSTSQPTEEDLIKDNISVISDSSSISTTASISSSDTPTRRILRKRGTESPFPENDNNKKIFKEPPAKSAMGTPKTAKNEKTPTDIVSPGSTISKRNLRSPGSEADTTQNLAKKPRLESPGRKSARFRNLNDDCLEEVELPVVTTDINDFTSEKEIFSVLTPDIPEVSQSPRKSIRREINQDKNLEHVQKQTDKIHEVMKIVETVVTKDKPQKQDKKDSTKTFDLLDPGEQVPKKLLPREVLNIEAIEETSTRPLTQENITATKSSVSAKKSLRSEEVKTPEVIKKLDDKVETKLPVKKLHRGEVLDIETLETTPTESIDTSSLTLEHEDISNTKQNVNAKKALRSEDAKILKNIQTSLDETNIDSVIINKSPTKSPGSVLTFSDWLKNKTQTDATEHEDNLKSQQTATEESSKVEPKLKSKKKTKKSSTKTAEITKAKVENKESTDNPNNNTQEEAMLHLEKEHSDKSTSMLDISDNTSTVEQESTLIDSMENTQTTLEDDNSLLEPALNQLTDREMSKKHRRRPHKKFRSGSKRPATFSAKKQTTIENPQEIQQVSQDNITINEENDKSNNSLDKSNPTPKPKPKKSERDLLIESMSKEMKEGGIQDLLNVDKHVKRQRLASRKKLTSSKEQLNITTTETAESSISSDFSLVKESPKVIEFSDMAKVATKVTTQAKDNTIKSPTKRQAAIQPNVKKSKRSLQAIDTLINAIVNDDGLSEEVPATSVIQDLAPTTLSKPRRRQAIQKEKTISKELQTTQTTAQPIGPAEAVAASSLKQMPILTKSKKSLKTKDTMKKIITTAPITSPEVTTTALPVVTKSRKSTKSTKQQPINEAQINVNDLNPFVNKVNTNIFKAPKPITHSAILNKIPTVENIKQLYADTNKRPQSRNLEKFKHSKISSPTFKCRKLRVRLNRSLVKRYWMSLKQKNVMTPVLISATSSAKVRENLHSASAIPVIQHNEETNLRIQSVVSTANVLNGPLEILDGVNIVTQDSVPEQLMPQITIPPIIDNPPYFVPTTANVTQSLDSEVPLELKYEFVDENPNNIENAILPDTPTLLARAQTITQAAQHALSNSITPTDIRLLTAESSAHAYVSSFGVSPTALNNKGTCLYTFLHPAKYNRNHSNVLLDFCCPNLDGPMPAIDPTRIHSQVQIPVIELPACIVLTTKVVTRAELESKNSSIPAIIRKKAERIRSNIAAHHNIATAASTATVTQSKSAVMTQPHLPPPPRLQPQIPQPQLSSTMNALAKHLPPTTTITPKIRPAQSQPSVVHQQPTVSVTAKGQPGVGNRISSYIQPLRSNLRRFDVLQKQLCQPFDSLTFVDRHRIIESIITSGKLSPKDLERTLILMEEYLTQISLLKSQTKHIYAMSAQNSPTTMPSLNQMPQLQPAPNILASSSSSSAYATASKQLDHPQNKSMRKIQTPSNRNTNLSSSRGSGEMEQRHVPIYDTDRNIIGYQLQPMSAKPTYTKSTMSSRTSGGIMSTSLENQITSYSISKRPLKRPAQDSPRVFYTTPPLHTSTPIATNPHVYNTNPSSSNALSQKTHQHKGSIVTTVRSSGGSNQSGSSETITTTTMATVKRVTRSTATGSKIIIVSKSNQSSEETILPDIGRSEAETAEIKNENDMEDFIG